MEFTEVGGADDEEDEDKYEQEDKIPQKVKNLKFNQNRIKQLKRIGLTILRKRHSLIFALEIIRNT